jgi:PAS domain S-box-containing protein
MPKLRSRTTLTFNVVATSLALICQAAVGASVFAEEAKPAEPAAASELEQLRAVLDTIPDIIFYKDRDGVYLGGNRAWRELIGDPVDFTGKTDFDLFPAEVAKGFREMDKAMLASNEPSRNDEWVTYPDGRRVLLETVKTPLVGGDGQVRGVLGISRDITNREARDVEGVKTATANWYAALNTLFTGDARPMKDAWSHEEDVTYMGPAGDYRVGWSEIDRAWDAQAAQKLGGRVTPTRINTVVGKDMAVVNCVERGDNIVDGKEERVEIRSSTAFRLEGGAWKAIGHQTDLLSHVDGERE